MADPGPMDLGPWTESTHAYVKSRVETVLSRTVTAASGTSTFRFWLTDEQMQRKSGVAEQNGVSLGFDAELGTLWFLVESRGEITASVAIFWEIPNSPLVYANGAATSVPLSMLRSVQAWAGPIPGRVAFDITLTNGGSATLVTLRADLCARRWGGNFERQHFLIDATSQAPTPSSLPAFDPNPERPGRPRKASGGGSCEKRAAKAQRDATRAVAALSRSSGPDSPTAMHDPGSLPIPTLGTPVNPRIGGRQLPDQPGYNNDGGAEGAPCTPDAGALDWIKAIAVAASQNHVGHKTQVMDPEVVVAMAQFGGNLQLSGAAVPPGHALDGKTLDLLQDIVPLVEGASTGIGSWFGRCVGFDALWDEVSLGLEKDRVPVETLKRVMKSGIQPPGGITEWIDARDDADTAWLWNETCPWFHQPIAGEVPGGADALAEERCTWFVASMHNLVHATLDLAPRSIRSPRTGTDDAVILRGFEDGRLDRAHPEWRVVVTGQSDDFHSISEMFGAMDVHPFDVGQGRWASLGHDRGKFVGGLRGTTKAGFPAKTLLVPILVVPYVNAAAECYQVARLLTMIVASTPSTGIAANLSGTPVPHHTLMGWAKYYYRAHLACLLDPAQTLVHELFHVTAVGPQISPIPHCQTGCGQEKMSWAWIQALGEKFELPWAERVADGKGMNFLPDKLAAQSTAGADAGSFCNFSKTFTLETSISKFGASGSVLTWAGASSQKSAQRCSADDKSRHTELLAEAAGWSILGSVYASVFAVKLAEVCFVNADQRLSEANALSAACPMVQLSDAWCWDGAANTCAVGGPCGS